MDNMPDFDSMTPEEMMAWMEALAKRQGATEGLVTAGDMEVPEIDPDTVGEIDEPGYIPYGMEPEVWALKKAKEDAERAERIAAMKADKAQAASARLAATEPAPADEPDYESEEILPAAAASPLDFLADMSGMAESPDTSPYMPVEEPEAVASAAPLDETPLEDLFADLSGAVVSESSGDMDWLASLGQSSGDMPDFDNLDFGSFEALETPATQGENNPLEWLESLVGSGDSDKIEAVAEPEAAASVLDDMLIESDDILEESAVSAVLNDPMEWLADFSDTQPVDEMAEQAASSREVLAMSDDLDAFFDRIQATDEEEPLPDFDLNRPMGELVDSGLMDFGGTPDFDEAEAVGVSSALTQGTEVPPEDVKAWMDSLLDRGIQRTDVTDEDDDVELEAEVLAELPDWLVEQVGEPPSQEELLSASGDDLPEWLTAPVSDTQNAEFEEMFNQMSAEAPPLESSPQIPEFDSEVAPLDTGVIRVQMNDPWVEAFELERDERLSDTGRLAAWYESAAHEVQAAQREFEENSAPATPVPVTAASSLKAAQLPVDDELPPGEPQAVPTWLGGPEPVAPIAAQPITDTSASLQTSDEDLPDWLRAAQLESDEVADVPTWLTDSLSTDEFEILQLGGQPDTSAATAALQDEPTSPVPVHEPASRLPETPAQTPISQRPTSELPRVTPRQPREIVAPHEAATIINQARASQKMGEIPAMLDAYERLVRSEVALEDVETEMEKIAKDPVHKTNPSVLRVYGDVLLRRGKLQQALDTYRAALNLL